MNNLTKVLERIDSLVWGPPLLILLVGTGIYLTVRLGLLQVFKLPLAIKYLFAKDDDSEGEGMYQVLQPFVQPCQQLLVPEI